jgi:hypothetical protein
MTNIYISKQLKEKTTIYYVKEELHLTANQNTL